MLDEWCYVRGRTKADYLKCIRTSMRESSVRKRKGAVFFYIREVAGDSNEVVPWGVWISENIGLFSRVDACAHYACVDYLPSTGQQVVALPTYSPDLAACDYAVCPCEEEETHLFLSTVS